MMGIKKSIISLVIAFVIIAVLPFTGSLVNAAGAEKNITKISIKLNPGEIKKPGYEADLPNKAEFTIDTANTDTNTNEGLYKGLIEIYTVCWQYKESNGTWTDIAGPADIGTYRLHVGIETNAKNSYNDPTATIYCFDQQTSKCYMNESLLDGSISSLAEMHFYGPEITVTSTSKTEYVSEGGQQDPTPDTQEDLSEKITGAPTNLECTLNKYNARQVDVKFKPNLTCGIDKYCGIVVAASTDNKKTWQVVDSWDFVSGTPTIETNTYALSSETYFKMDLEKTYYVKVYYVDSEGKKGPDSNIVGPLGPIEDESKIPGKVEAASKSAVKVTGNDKAQLKVGDTTTFTRAFYTMNVKVKKIKGSDVTLVVSLTGNAPYDKYLSFSTVSVGYLDTKGKANSEFLTNDEVTIDLNNLAPGCNRFKIPVTATLSRKYDINEKKYKFDEIMYFEVAPQAKAISASKADKKSITFGKAYSNKVNCTTSGTTILYRKKGSSAWKEKNFAKGATMKITGLKAGTAYQVKAVNYVKSKDHNGKVKLIKNAGTAVKVFNTAYKSGPAASSVKVTKLTQQTKHFNGQWVKSGIRFKWMPAFTSDVTSYKMEVRFKKKPKNAKGIIVVNPDGVVKVIKGSKSKYKISGDIKGFAKGKTVKFKIATFANGSTVSDVTGISPYKTISVRMQ